MSRAMDISNGGRDPHPEWSNRVSEPTAASERTGLCIISLDDGQVFLLTGTVLRAGFDRVELAHRMTEGAMRGRPPLPSRAKDATLRQEIEDIERRAKMARLRMDVLLSAADCDRSSWTRWKNGTAEPGLLKWRKIEAALAAAENGRKP